MAFNDSTRKERMGFFTVISGCIFVASFISSFFIYYTKIIDIPIQQTDSLLDMNPGTYLTSSEIFIHNIEVGFAALVGGFLTAGIAAIFVVAANGLQIGLALSYAGSIDSLLGGFLLMAPHGILEVPALLLFGAAGIEAGFFGLELSKQYFTDEIEESIKWRETLREPLVDLLILAGIAFVLLILASILEAHLTPEILRAYLG